MKALRVVLNLASLFLVILICLGDCGVMEESNGQVIMPGETVEFTGNGVIVPNYHYKNIQPIPAKWQQIEKHTSRMWIPEGWIVRCLSSYETGNHFIIAKDPNHTWRIK